MPHVHAVSTVINAGLKLQGIGMIRQTGAILASRGLKQLIASSYGQLACHEASALCGAFGSFRYWYPLCLAPLWDISQQ